jgi:hypothetical protein
MKSVRNTSLLAVLVLVGMTAFAVTASAADDKKDSKDSAAGNATGTWKWSFAGQNGQTRETTAKLKQDGDKLTGTISGRQGGNDTEITDGKVKGNEVSFKVKRSFNGNDITMNYEGKIEGDTIKGKISTTGGQQERPARDWEAKRDKDAKDAK